MAARWHQTVEEKIQGFGGVTIQSVPSPIIAVFGIPQTLEQMPQRAVQAALTIRHQFAEASATDGRQSCPAVGWPGIAATSLWMSRRGPRPRASSRWGRRCHCLYGCSGMLRRGDILLSPEIGRLVEGWFELHRRDGAVSASMSDGVGAYGVVGLGPRCSPLEIYGKRPLSRFVGRERELTTLRDLLAHVAQGYGQVVGIVGEPGVGKSRLCYELTQTHPPQGWLILESSPTAYGKESPYLPVIALLTAYFQLEARGER